MGRCIAWDVTCPDTLVASHRLMTSVTIAAAVERAALLKHIKYAEIKTTYDFVSPWQSRPLARSMARVWPSWTSLAVASALPPVTPERLHSYTESVCLYPTLQRHFFSGLFCGRGFGRLEADSTNDHEALSHGLICLSPGNVVPG